MALDSLGQYLNDIGRIPLLSPAEEIHLSARIHAGQAIEDEIPEAERTRAQQRIVIQGKRAKTRMVEGNLRLVVTIAKKYRAFGLDMLDLIQEGTLGLTRAAEKFDETRGYKFSTYAYWWIRQSITRALDQYSRVIRLPLHLNDMWIKIRRFTSQYERDHNRQPTIAQIAKGTDLEEHRVREVMSAYVPIQSLDKVVDGDPDKSSLHGLIADTRNPDPIDQLMQCDMPFIQKLMITKLTERERIVLELVFGTTPEGQLTLDKIGKTLPQRLGDRSVEISRERVRQIRDNAVRKLQVAASYTPEGRNLKEVSYQPTLPGVSAWA